MRVRSDRLAGGPGAFARRDRASVGPEPDRRDFRQGDRRVRAPCCRACRSRITSPVLLQPLTGDDERDRVIPVPAPRRRHLHREVRAPGLQDRRQGRHPGHGRLQRERQHAAGRVDCAGDRDGHRREPDRRHEADRHEADLHDRDAAEHSVGARPVGHPAADGRHRDGPREHRRQHVGPAVQLRVARRATRPTTSGRSTASTSPTCRRPARRRATTTSTRSRK